MSDELAIFMFDGGAVWALAEAGEHADVPPQPEKSHEWEAHGGAQERPWAAWTGRRTNATRRTWILVPSS